MLKLYKNVTPETEQVVSLSNNMVTKEEAYTDFLQILTSAVRRIVADPDVRKVLVEFLAFENTNT